MNIIAELEAADAVMRNRHFIYKSGRHGDGYINFDYMFPDVNFMSKVGRMMAELVLPLGVDTLVAPATGGVALLQWVSHWMRHLSGRWPMAYWADKQPGGGFAIERANWSQQLKAKKVVGVEDATTTGGSLAGTISAARLADADVVGAIAITNRGGVTRDILGVDYFEALSEISLNSFAASDCPHCAEEIPVVNNVGRPDFFLRQNPTYPQYAI